MVADAVTRVHSMTSKQGHFATSDRFDRPERSQSFEKFIFWNAVNPTDPLPRHTTFDANRWKDPRTVFYRIHEIHSFIWRWYWKKLAISSHFLRHFYEKTRYALQISGIWKTLDKRSGVTDTTLYHSSLLKTFVYLTCSFWVILHYWELWIIIIKRIFKLLTTQRQFLLEANGFFYCRFLLM